MVLLEQIHAITGKCNLVFAGDTKPWKPMYENTVNAALKMMSYDTKVESAATDSEQWRAVRWPSPGCDQR